MIRFILDFLVPELVMHCTVCCAWVGAEFGVRGRRIYLRNIAGDFEFGTNFASSGGSALNVTGWKPESGFRMPFSLNVQMQWFQRSVVRIQTYYSNKSTFGDAAGTFSSTSATSSMTFNIFDPLRHLNDIIYMEINSKSSKAYLGTIMSLEVTVTFVFPNAALVFPENMNCLAVVTDVLPTEASLKQSLNCTWCTLASMTTS